MDYCRALTCTDAGLEVVLQSNASITLPAGTPYLALSPEGRLVHYAAGTAAAEELDIELNVRDTWYEAPTLAVSADGFLIVAGRETDIVSTGRCVMDCGKYVYYYAGSSVVPVASEICERFNQPLPKDRGLLKVLFVGNSFNVDATAHLPGILTADGTQRVLMGGSITEAVRCRNTMITTRLIVSARIGLGARAKRTGTATRSMTRT